jgi:endogenous inhibitor of DNA gyrase (YacG/DUF329 family)
MRIITHTCPECGTVVAANELEDHRIMKCPGSDCETVLRFDDLTDEEQEYFIENREQYEL